MGKKGSSGSVEISYELLGLLGLVGVAGVLIISTKQIDAHFNSSSGSKGEFAAGGGPAFEMPMKRTCRSRLGHLL